jgi:hypothetical protein
MLLETDALGEDEAPSIHSKVDVPCTSPECSHVPTNLSRLSRSGAGSGGCPYA